jgi:hypothetical protein
MQERMQFAGRRTGFEGDCRRRYEQQHDGRRSRDEEHVIGATTGNSRLSPKDASTQGAGTAGAVDRRHFSCRNHEEVTSRQERFSIGKIMQSCR